ncbi:MAG: exodeoxyribonuclease III [Gammaproteobacteria bacterium]|nr:MAG: exodeoxyribonuclease III [Gammaproteobacteria bacterium]
MKIATWNVNSLRARLEHVLRWLELQSPDILGIQEIKMADEEFPLMDFKALGYEAAVSGQRGYNGVALLSRFPIEDTLRDIPGLHDPERRVLAATIKGLRIVNLYVPNGGFVGSKKFDYKLAWLRALASYLKEELERYPETVVMGDLNIAPEDRDVYNPKLWEGRIMCSEEERAAFRALLDIGFCDVFRLFHPESGHHTWWDYRGKAFEKNRGLRIDHILASTPLCQRFADCFIDTTPRTWDKPSDHAPVVAVLKA